MRFLVYPLCIFLMFLNIFSNEGQVITYNTGNFSVEVAKQNNFVMFYARWCAVSQWYSKIWNKLAEQFNTNESNVVIAQVDCDRNLALCSDIKAVPTLKFYKLGDSEGVFVKKNTLDKMARFINEQLGEEKSADGKPINNVGIQYPTTGRIGSPSS